MLDLENAVLVGRGTNRFCYVHPQNPDLCVKVAITDDNGASEKEVSYYRRLAAKGVINWVGVSECHGEIETSLGQGAVFELVRDFDGEISKSLHRCLDAEHISAAVINKALRELHASLIERDIIFRDLSLDNLVFQRLNETEGLLVIIDGLGNGDFVPIADYVHFLAKRKINRKWQRFEKQLRSTFDI